jgi:hypothetical protein
MKIFAGTPHEGLTLEGHVEEQFYDPSHNSGDEVLEEVKRTLRSPQVELFVNRGGPRGSRTVFFAVGEKLTSVLMSRPDQPQQVAAVTHESIPGIIARTVELGPAPFREGKSSSLSGRDFETLINNPSEAAGIVGDRAFEKLFTRDNWSMWYLQRSAPSVDGGVDYDRLDIVGATDHGWWILEPGGSRVQSERTRAATIWAMLCGGI